MEIVEDLLDPHQIGFRKGSSTVQALAALIHNWLTAMEKPDMVVQVLKHDFRKAFDKVDQTILLSMLANTGYLLSLSVGLQTFCMRRNSASKSDQSHYFRVSLRLESPKVLC